MKKLILFLTVFFTFFGVKAQDSTTDYIYSGNGFEVKTGYYTEVDAMGKTNTYRSTGLYSSDGKLFVSCISSYVKWDGSSSYSTNDYFYIIDGCETICSGAFSGVSNKHIYIPSSIKNIAPDALKTNGTYLNKFVGMADGCKEETNAAVKSLSSDPNATEVARYNINGIKLNEPTGGINIVQMSDGTAEKVLIK